MPHTCKCKGCQQPFTPEDIAHHNRIPFDSSKEGLCCMCWALGTPDEFLDELLAPGERALYEQFMKGGEQPMISEFRGLSRYLSNFYPLDVPIRWLNIEYPTSEHMFAAFKTMSLEDRVWISMLKEPKYAKWAGGPKGYEGKRITLRGDWEQEYNGAPVKVYVMRHVLTLKYTFNQQLIYHLCGTHPKQLVEGNRWCDNYWGNCTCPKCTHIPGQNLLGRLHMELRELYMMIH